MIKKLITKALLSAHFVTTSVSRVLGQVFQKERDMVVYDKSIYWLEKHNEAKWISILTANLQGYNLLAELELSDG